MTTIAYKDGVIAYDGRVRSCDTVVDDSFDKHLEKDGVHFFISGVNSDFDKFIKMYLSGELKSDHHMEIHAVILDKGRLYTAAYDDGTTLWVCPERAGNHFSVGSGSHHAITAMDCGLSAKEAVKMAAKRDSATGGKIRTFKVK